MGTDIAGRGAVAALLAILLLGPLSGCIGGTYDGADSDFSSPPRVDFASPGTETQSLPEAASITFSAEGTDADSLELDWQWELGGALQAFGGSEDGSFETSWTLNWDPSLSGQYTEVRFAVYDATHGTELFWPVQVD